VWGEEYGSSLLGDSVGEEWHSVAGRIISAVFAMQLQQGLIERGKEVVLGFRVSCGGKGLPVWVMQEELGRGEMFSL